MIDTPLAQWFTPFPVTNLWQNTMGGATGDGHIWLGKASLKKLSKNLCTYDATGEAIPWLKKSKSKSKFGNKTNMHNLLPSFQTIKHGLYIHFVCSQAVVEGDCPFHDVDTK